MDHRDWKAEAANDLRQPNYSPRKIVLIHTGAVAALSVLLSLIGLLLSIVADNAGGGLSGMGTQTLLATIQTALPVLVMLVQPFWNVGIQQVALNYGENRTVSPRDLLGGFYRWKPIVTSSLMLAILYMGRIFIASFLAEIVVITPFSNVLMEAMETQSANTELDVIALLGDELVPFVLTYGLVFAGLLIAFALPVYYRYRFVNYLLLEQPGMGGMQAMFISRAMTQGHRKELFKLDLSFWWFYLAELLITALSSGNLILELMGIKLPMSAMASSWLFLLLSLGAQLALHCFAKPILEVSWAKAYRNISNIPLLYPMGTDNVVDAEKSE